MSPFLHSRKWLEVFSLKKHMDFYSALSDIRRIWGLGISIKTGGPCDIHRQRLQPLLSGLSECWYPELFTLQAFSCYSFRVNKKGPKDPTCWIKINPHKITDCETCEHIVKSQNPGSRTVVLVVSFQTKKKYYTQKIRNHRLFNTNTISQRTMEQCFENAEGKWFLKI